MECDIQMVATQMTAECPPLSHDPGPHPPAYLAEKEAEEAQQLFGNLVWNEGSQTGSRPMFLFIMRWDVT